MLKELRIESFAIIDQLVLRMEKGLLVVTGETGAGKSILFNALTLVMGKRASTEMIRHGSKQAIVSARFELNRRQQIHLAPILEEYGCPIDEELHIRRFILANGRNRVFINGELSSLKALSALTTDLIEVVGQHASHGLLDESLHLDILDDFADVVDQSNELAKGVKSFRTAINELERLKGAQKAAKFKARQLQDALDEIDMANLSSEEEQRLQNRLIQIQAAEEISQKSLQASVALESNQGSALDAIGVALSAVASISHLSPELSRLLDVLSSAQIELTEAGRDLRHIGENSDWSEHDLAVVQERLFVYSDLKNKYGGRLEDVDQASIQIKAELHSLDSDEETLLRLSEQVVSLSEWLLSLAESLRQSRQSAAKRLQAAVEQELSELGMKPCRFQVSFQPIEGELEERGLDRVSFLIAPNPGEGLKPLAKIASGGELSRILLALKVALISSRRHCVYLFDEVDSGIGGGVAETVGRKLRAVGDYSQALCITHLAQVASCAHHHYRVSKEIHSGRTASKMKLLDRSERIQEISRMIGAVELTEGSRLHAIEMLERNQVKDMNHQGKF